MPQFWSPNYTGRFTPEELDTLAIKGEPIDAMGYGYKCRPEGDALESEHYGVRTINTRGMGNHGSVILVGKTPHGRRMVRRGKIARLTRDGCLADIAEVAVSMPYGMEARVWKLAEELLPLARMGVSLRCTGHRHFEAVTGIRDHGCSFPRVNAGVAIAERVAGCGGVPA